MQTLELRRAKRCSAKRFHGATNSAKLGEDPKCQSDDTTALVKNEPTEKAGSTQVRQP